MGFPQIQATLIKKIKKSNIMLDIRFFYLSLQHINDIIVVALLPNHEEPCYQRNSNHKLNK